MADIELVIKVDEEIYQEAIKSGYLHHLYDEDVATAFIEGTPLPKGHGRIVDIGKIDEDKIDSSNPIISLTIGGEYIEAVSLDYLNNLKTIIEADKEESEDKE